MAIEVIEIVEIRQETDTQHNTTSPQYKNLVATIAPLSAKRKRKTYRYFKVEKN